MALTKVRDGGTDFTGAISSFQLLNTTTVSSGTTNVDIEQFSSTYTYYKIIAHNIVKEAASDQKLECRIKESGSYNTSSNYLRRVWTGSNANTTYTYAYTTGSAWVLTPSGAVEDGTTTHPMYLEMDIYNPTESTITGMQANFKLDYVSYHPYNIFNYGALSHTANNWEGIRFFFSSGNFEGGVFKIYGTK
tara:strand:- start:294 stop:866 length:573 start_codon:yes stop_codon:yes gene_type:complete